MPIPPAYARNWAFAHGIIRQESSFERTAVSNAGARGLMQLMPGTARQAAGRVGVPYELGRLTEDPQYNVLLGSYYLSELMDEWGGNAVLVAAAYNAGSGNVRRWIASQWRPAHAGRRRRALDRGDPLLRDPQLRPAGAREHGRLRSDEPGDRPAAAARATASLTILGQMPSAP